VQPLAVLTIAGSDSGGGAGIQADLRTFAARGVHGTTAITAITAQNTERVDAVCALEPEMVRTQVETITSDITLSAVKTGMLARPATVREVATLAERGLLPHLVVDPVLVSSTGAPLMEEGGVDAYRDALIPQSFVVTPNLREASVLSGVNLDALRSTDDLIEMGRRILNLGATWVLVKGGHALEGSATADRAPDILIGADSVDIFDGPRVTTNNDHGTGCSTAACLAAELAKGKGIHDAVRTTKAFVAAALQGGASWHLGHGHGPIDHMGWNR
jgi:hydroxymethylpyrimidine/phosphomethylpyrimidine kinase